MINIVLASTSPRRADLLRLARIDFDVLAVAIDETLAQGESPNAYILRMAEQKAQAAFNELSSSASAIPQLILAADTIGVLPSGQVLTKPKDQQDAFAMWQAMSGTWHEVWTAVSAILLKDGQKIWQSTIKVATKVHFVVLDEAMMADYWAMGEPQDKAGGYAIQGFGATWVRGIDGDYSNVVGLPLTATLALIKTAKQLL